MHIKNHGILGLIKLNLILIIASNCSEVIAVPASLLVPVNRVSPSVSSDVNASRLLRVPPIDNQRMLDVVHADAKTAVDSRQMVLVCTEEIAQRDKAERCRRLRDIFARYVECAHLVGDDGLAAVISENLGHAFLDDVDDVDDVDDISYYLEVCKDIRPMDSSMIIHQAVRRVLDRHSFETLASVSVAIQELEQTIFSDLSRYGIATDAQLVRDLKKLNSEPLSASYHCMQQVSQILGQLPPESAQAIREQFPWYLKRMV